MKHVLSLAAVAAALVLVACGGSGSSSSSTTGSTPGTSSGIPSGAHIEAVVLNPTTFDNGSQSNGQTFVIQDPNDIESQDQVQFQLVYYDASGARVVLPASQWSTSDQSNSYGTIAYNSGVFTASRAQTQDPLTVSVIYKNIIFSSYFQVLARQVRLRGVLLSDTTHKPVSGVEIDFYGPENPTIVGSPEVFRGRVVTAYDGSFRASVPNTVTGFTLVNKTLPLSYQRFYKYDNQFYNTGDTNCLAALPTYTNGEYFLVDYTNSDVNTNNTILLVPSAETTPSATCGKG